MDVRELEIRGYEGASVPCVLHLGERALGMALVLPRAARSGNRIGGTPARPDLHFTRALLQQHGLSVLETWWDAGAAPDGGVARWLRENALAAAREAKRHGSVRVLVGRSIGTGALAALVSGSDWERTPFDGADHGLGAEDPAVSLQLLGELLDAERSFVERYVVTSGAPES